LTRAARFLHVSWYRLTWTSRDTVSPARLVISSHCTSRDTVSLHVSWYRLTALCSNASCIALTVSTLGLLCRHPYVVLHFMCPELSVLQQDSPWCVLNRLLNSRCTCTTCMFCLRNHLLFLLLDCRLVAMFVCALLPATLDKIPYSRPLTWVMQQPTKFML
jgi:hypothetical protein